MRLLSFRLVLALCAIAVLSASLSQALPLFLTANDGLDVKGRPLFTDFIAFWSAGRLALTGHAIDAYNEATLLETTRLALPAFDARLPWLYPPIFFLPLLPFALLPYLWSAALFQLATLSGLLLTLRRHLDRLSLLLVLAAPAIFYNAIQGQNGCLTAALLAGGILNLEKRPALAGILLGGLAYKPQFVMLTPLLLLAGKHYRVLAFQAGTVAALFLLTSALFGADIWLAFQATAQKASHLLTAGAVKWYKVGSPLIIARMLGAPVELAWLLHALVALPAAALALWVWRRTRESTPRLMAATAAILLAAPFQYDYDFAMLLPAMLLWAQSRPTRIDWYLLMLLWLGPYLAFELGPVTNIQAMALLLGAMLIRAMQTAQARPQSGTTQTA